MVMINCAAAGLHSGNPPICDCAVKVRIKKNNDNNQIKLCPEHN